MAELVASGPKPSQRWRYPLADGPVIRLGRAPRDKAGWAVPWDYLISREHADLRFVNGRLWVRCLETARNPIYFHERPAAEFLVAVGEEFRIGTTRFRLQEPRRELPTFSVADGGSVEERSFSAHELSRSGFGNSGDRLEALARLPALFSRSRNDEEFADRLAELLLAAIAGAQATAVIVCDCPAPHETESDAEIPAGPAPGQTPAAEEAVAARMLHPQLIRCRTRTQGLEDFRPSGRLVQTALERSESVVHVWSEAEDTGGEYTVHAQIDWAYCTPIRTRARRSWCLYVAGTGALPNGIESIKGDLRFTQLLAEFTGAVRRMRRLERQQEVAGEFVSPPVREVLTDSRADSILAPRILEITTLFCDLRGFSRAAEQSRRQLRELLSRVSDALGVMTRSILRYDGVVADFQGDAALGFWGWPRPCEDGPLPACRAALRIQEEFRRANQQRGNSLHDFRVGIGIAHGPGIAGRLGTAEQAKVGAFGPVVDLGAQLEGLTKLLRAPILLDQFTMDYVKAHLPPDEGRCRRLGCIRPPDAAPLILGQLLPSADQEPSITDEQIADFEAAVDLVHEGQWEQALAFLERLPAADRVKDFLMIAIALHDYCPPDGWDGVINLPPR